MTTRGSYSKGVIRRDEILRVALEVFSREGYRGTTLRSVAAEVGVSLPGLMHYFDSKEHLLTEIMRTRDEVDTPEYAAAADPIDGLIAIVKHNHDVPGLVQLYLTLSAAADEEEHPAREFLTARMNAMLAGISDAVAERQRRGEAPATLDPDHIARVLVALADGLQVQWVLHREMDMAADLDRLWQLLTGLP